MEQIILAGLLGLLIGLSTWIYVPTKYLRAYVEWAEKQDEIDLDGYC